MDKLFWKKRNKQTNIEKTKKKKRKKTEDRENIKEN